MGKVIWGLLKFYYVYIGFGVLAVIILYASADLRLLIESLESGNGVQSFLQTMIHAPETLDDKDAAEAVLNYFKVAFDSVPGETYFNAVLNVSFDSNVGSDIAGLLVDLVDGGTEEPVLVQGLRNYELFWRDMAVATSASMVMYAVMHLKKKIAGRSISVILGFALASVFWIYASYTFGETVTFALERVINTDNLKALYIIIVLVAIGLESSIHAYGGKCSLLRLAALLCLKIAFNLVKCVFAWYMCSLIAFFINSQDMPSAAAFAGGITGIMTSGGIFFAVALLEAKLTDWAEKAHA